MARSYCFYLLTFGLFPGTVELFVFLLIRWFVFIAAVALIVYSTLCYHIQSQCTILCYKVYYTTQYTSFKLQYNSSKIQYIKIMIITCCCFVSSSYKHPVSCSAILVTVISIMVMIKMIIVYTDIDA
jgi:hypothetical protein